MAQASFGRIWKILCMTALIIIIAQNVAAGDPCYDFAYADGTPCKYGDISDSQCGGCLSGVCKATLGKSCTKAGLDPVCTACWADPSNGFRVACGMVDDDPPKSCTKAGIDEGCGKCISGKCQGKTDSATDASSSCRLDGIWTDSQCGKCKAGKCSNIAKSCKKLIAPGVETDDGCAVCALGQCHEIGDGTTPCTVSGDGKSKECGRCYINGKCDAKLMNDKQCLIKPGASSSCGKCDNGACTKQEFCGFDNNLKCKTCNEAGKCTNAATGSFCDYIGIDPGCGICSSGTCTKKAGSSCKYEDTSTSPSTFTNSICGDDGKCQKPGTFGACCTDSGGSAGGGCLLRSEEYCKNNGYIFLGSEKCDATAKEKCKEQGFCCNKDQTAAEKCTTTTKTQCESNGHTWLGKGKGINCDKCTQLGACCGVSNSGTPSCLMKTSDECLKIKGIFSSADKTCAPSTCAGTVACCTPSGCTYAKDAAACTSMGGTSQGTTACKASLCKVSPCCSKDAANTCDMKTEAACTAAGGFVKSGSKCVTNPKGGTCGNYGSCCLVGSTNQCVVKEKSACLAEGGAWGGYEKCPDACTSIGSCCKGSECKLVSKAICDTYGDKDMFNPGGTCSASACAAKGACCTAGTCSSTYVTQAECNSQKGFWAGAKKPCSACDKKGACCKGSCSEVNQASACKGAGSSFNLGKTCADVSCPTTTTTLAGGGACCTWKGCSHAPRASACSGTYHPGMDCKSVTCPSTLTPTPTPIIQACCSPTGACTMTNPATCYGRSFSGNCADVNCGTPTPTSSPLVACCPNDGGSCYMATNDVTCIFGDSTHGAGSIRGYTCSGVICSIPTGCPGGRCT